MIQQQQQQFLLRQAQTYTWCFFIKQYLKRCGTDRRPAGGKTVSHRLLWVVVVVVSRTRTKYRAARGNHVSFENFVYLSLPYCRSLFFVSLDEIRVPFGA
jgi:hypothetical protein